MAIEERYRPRFDAALSDSNQRTDDLNDLSVANQRELERLLSRASIVDQFPTYNDLRLPVSYWSRRAALADALLEFKADGTLTLRGVVVSAAASLWSLYL